MRSAASREAAARRYRIEKYLTEGGMGAIYLGKKMGSGGFQKEVVLKQLLPEYTARPEFRDLFFREAKISATLDHANIVHTFDLVESDQSLFIVMEYVRGADLRTIVRRARQRQRELSPAAAIHIALEILAGLGYAHTRRDRRGVSLDIIHRDVSPSNIICSGQGEAKLSDFGIAKASTHSSVFYRVRGKVGYMSPEQARSLPIDHRCDLYSLAVCLYESLSGERLFVGDLNTPADEIYGHPILPISQKRAGLPGALDAVLARALAPDIADRHQSAAELSDALRTVAHKTGLAFSAPELAAHLREILGDNPERWLRDEASHVPAEPQNIPAASIGLVGKEAASIGIVADLPEDGEPPIVLSARGVSGSKDFDIDSMLDDEATRPGDKAPGPLFRSEAITPKRTSDQRRAITPPPVWTRNSGPIPIATPPPVRVAAPPPPAAVRAPSPSRAQPPASFSSAAGGAVPPPKPIAGGRVPPPRATQRAMSIPPPVPVASRVSVPPPPPLLPAALGDNRLRSPFGSEFEDATPPPPLSSNAPAAPHVASFDIEESPSHAPARWPAGPLPNVGSGPAAGRPQPPAGYYPPQQAAPVPVLPRLSEPQTIDFSGSMTLPEKKSGPPRWLVLAGLAIFAVGGAVLGHRATRDEVARLVAAAPAEDTRKPSESAPVDLAPTDSAPRPSNADHPRDPHALGLPVLEPLKQPVEAAAGAAGVAHGSAPASARAHATKPAAARHHAPVGAHKKPARRH